MTAVAEGLAANIASEASKGVFVLAKRHAGYCFHFRKYVTEFQTGLKNLESTRNDALERERRAKDNNEVIGEIGRMWLEGAEVLLSDAEELKKKIEEQSMCVIEWCPNCIHRYRLGRKAAKKTPELNKHNADFKSNNFSHPVCRLGMEFHAPIDFVDLDSRKVAYDQVWKALQDEQKLRVGVYAMGGSGKTTLVKELGYKAEGKQLFEKVVFVVVSNPPDVRRIQENTASQLGLKFEYNQESDRAKELWSRLTNGEKILIILDDVWEKLDFKAIGIPFEDKHKGCRVLLTTRSVGVCTTMECQLKIELSLLTKEDSWKLFQKYADISNDPSALLDVAQEILSECKGLPVAIVIVARMLRSNELQEWKYALRTLKDAKPVTGIDEHLIEIYNCLRLSYDNLKSKEVQELFLLCSSFPEDYTIPMEDLTRYAMGLGLFEYDGSFEKMRDKMVKAIKILTNSCLLLNAEKFFFEGECVKMHDLVREAAQWIANKKIKEIMESKIDDDALNTARYLWFHMTKDLPNQLNCPRLEFLMISVETKNSLSFSFEEKEAFFRGLDNLCVLILKWTYVQLFKFSIKLPQSIQELKSLQSLHLKSLKLGDISVIGSLKSLESLELCYCEIDELPSRMVELKNLRLLDLSNCRILQNPFEVIGKFTKLEELYYFEGLRDSFRWKVDGENISDFFGENCQLIKLIRYFIQIGGLSGKLNNYLIPRGLCIDCFHPSTSNATIKNLVQRAEYLCLNKIQGGYKNIVPDVVRAVGGKIQFIRLHLYYCNDIECLIDATNVSMLPELVELQVDDMDNLKELWRGTPPSGFLEKLEKLDVQYCSQLRSILFVGNLNLRSLKVVRVGKCSKLTSLFTLSVALSLVLLEELQISDCYGLEYIIAGEREWEKDDYDHKIGSGSIFPKLKSVEISFCGSLDFIFPIWLAGRLVQLEQIKIRYATKLKHIFGQYQDEVTPLHQNDKEIILPSLQRIELEEIQNFNSIFPIDCHPKDCSQGEATDLEATTPRELHPSQNQVTTWYTSTVQCLSRQLENLCHIRDCAQVKATTLDATTSTELHASQNRDIRLLPYESAVQYCLSRQLLNLCHITEMKLYSLPAKVVSLFTLSTAQKMLVKNLTIGRCHGLKHIITDGEEVDFDHKDYVSIFPELQDLFMEACNLLEFIFPACFAQCPAKLESLKIKNAPELKYVFGQCYHDNYLSHQNENVIHMELPALENLNLESLPKIIAMCHRTYHPTWPSLKKLKLKECPQLPTKSIIDFMICSDASKPYCITTKAGSMLSELAQLEELVVERCPQLPSIFVGNLSFCNLKVVRVIHCQTLISLFTLSIALSLVLLEELKVLECCELKYITDESDWEKNQKIFPKLKSLEIGECDSLDFIFPVRLVGGLEQLEEVKIIGAAKLKHIFGVFQDEDKPLHQNDKQIMLPSLQTIQLQRLPNFISIFPIYSHLKDCPQVEATSLDAATSTEVDFDHKDYVSIFPELQDLKVHGCNLLEFIFPACFAQGLAKLKSLDIQEAPELKSVFGQCHHNDHLIDFMICSDAREPDCITTKAILRHDNMLNIETPCFGSYGIEGIFPMEGILMNGQQDQLTSRFKGLQLRNLPELRHICMGPPQCLSFENLYELEVSGCGKLSCIFSVSVLRSLPLLIWLTIKNCNELEQIIEDEEEDQVLLKHYSHNVCFPNLIGIKIKQCNKLKCLFSISQSNEFPELEKLSIKEASQLEEVFRWRLGESQDRENTVLPNLEELKLVKLPCITNVCQGFKLPTDHKLEVRDCPKLPPEYQNAEEEEISEEEIGEEDDTRLPSVTSPGSTKINAIQHPESVPSGESVEGKEAKQEEAEHEEGKKGEEVISEQPTTSADNKKLHMAVVQTTTPFMIDTALPTIADSDSAESNTIDEKESRDAAPQTSSDFPSGSSGEAPKELYPSAAPQTCTTQAINMNEKIQERSSNPLVVPPSSNFPSSTSEEEERVEEIIEKEVRVGDREDDTCLLTVTSPGSAKINAIQTVEGVSSGDARKELSASATQYHVTPIEETKGKEVVIEQFTAFVKSRDADPQTSTNQAINMNENIHGSSDNPLAVPLSRDFTTEIEKRSAQKDPKSEKAIRVTVSNDSKQRKKVLEAAVISIQKAYPQEFEGKESSNETIMTDQQRVKRSVREREKEIVQKSSASEKPGMVTSSTELEQGRPSPSTLAFPLQKNTSHELVDEQLLCVPILMEQQQNAHAETQITTEIPQRIANTASNENIEGKVQQDVQESSISEEAIIVTPPIDSEPQKSSAGSLGIPILKAFPQCVTESVEGGPISEKSEILTSLTYSEPISMPQESMREESRNETMMMDKQSVDGSVEDFHTSEKDKIATSSTDSEPGSSFPVSFVTPLHETSPQCIIKETAKEIVQKCPMPAKPALATSSTGSELRRPSPSTLLGEITIGQTETYTNSDTEANPINLKDFEEDDLLKVFQTIKDHANVKESIPSVSVFSEELSTLDDNLTAKAFNDLEAFLKSPLKDIASSESNKLCLENALSVLSHCSSKDGALLARVKATIDSLHQNLPSILSSFKKATATIDKFTALEKNEKSIKEELPQREKVAITLISDISKTAKSMSKAQQKEAGLKEQISQLQLELESTEKEINNCEVNLSSLQERKKKLLADAVEFQKEFEVVTEDKSQMWEDQRKAQQELIKVNYEWYALCSQFEQDCTAARNPPQV